MYHRLHVVALQWPGLEQAINDESPTQLCIAGDPEPDECGKRRRKTSSKYTELSRLTRVLYQASQNKSFQNTVPPLQASPAMAKKRASSVSVCPPLKKKKVSVEGGPSGARSV